MENMMIPSMLTKTIVSLMTGMTAATQGRVGLVDSLPYGYRVQAPPDTKDPLYCGSSNGTARNKKPVRVPIMLPRLILRRCIGATDPDSH